MKSAFINSIFSIFVLPVLLMASVNHIYAETPDAGNGLQEPHLVFKKTVVVKDYADGKAHAEQHVMKKGEHLWQVLRERYNMSDTSINFFCKVAKAVNPEIEDLDVLEPNQNILLPFKFVSGDGSDNSTIVIETQDYHHVVKPNEHLGQILRNQYNLPNEVIFNRITKKLIQEANPDIEDLNEITPGQSITIPREVFVMQQFVEHDILPGDIVAARPVDKPVEQVSPVPEIKASDNESALMDMTFTEEPLNDDETEIKRVLSQMTRGFDGTDNSTGSERLGDDNQTLDYSQFPAYTFPWGKKVVFDYGKRLPDSTRSQINRTWENAEVVSVEATDDMESIIGRVLDVCGFYKVEKDAGYTVNRDAIQLSVAGNWIVFKDSSLRNVFVVNMAKDGKSSISPSLRKYLSGIGLDVMDIGLDENISDQTGTQSTTAYREISSAPAMLTDTILNILTIAYETDYKTSIFQNMYSGFSLEVVADRMFKINGETRLIDFNNLPERITTIITQQGFKLLQIKPGTETAEETAGRVLEFCNADFEAPPVTISFDQQDRQSVSLTMPGYLIKAPIGRVLLTAAEVEKSIADFLREENIAIVKY